MSDQRFSLTGKTIVITGASSGLGKGLASAYADEGANLVITSRNIATLEDLADEIKLKGVNVLPVKTDVTKRSDIENLLKTIKKNYDDYYIRLAWNDAGERGMLLCHSADTKEKYFLFSRAN